MKTITSTDDRIGGLHMVYVIPLGLFGGIGINYATGERSITLSSTSGVYALPCMAENYLFDEQHERDEHGDWWQPTIQGAIPHPDEVSAADIEELERGEWIVVCEDQNGVLRVCGDEDTQLTFSTANTSGTISTDKNQVAFTLTGKLGHPSYVVASPF